MCVTQPARLQKIESQSQTSLTERVTVSCTNTLILTFRLYASPRGYQVQVCRYNNSNMRRLSANSLANSTDKSLSSRQQ